MADQASSELPRIAFVFYDAALAAHVREAVAGHVEIVYAASSAEFEAARLADARVAAALVNVDGGDWLEAIEAKLQTTGVRVVFNDPEISQGLEGWERARWLRHLTAKLRGSMDFDPPRPVVPMASSPAAVANNELPDVVAAAPAVVSVPDAVPENEESVVERPLSPHEIETMTADFVAVPEMPGLDVPPMRSSEDLAVIAAVQVAPVAAPSRESRELPEALSENPAQATSSSIAAPNAASMLAAEPVLPVDVAASAQIDSDATGLLDVDTEALSAMIDARLAAPESHGLPSEGETWAIPAAANSSADTVETRTDSMHDQLEAHYSEEAPVPVVDAPAPPVITASDAGAPAAPAATASDAGAPTTPVVTAGDTDADVLASLPSLDDWRLLDPDTEVAPTAAPAVETKAPEPVLPDSFAGLELVPMETIVPIERNTDPIERWLDESETVRKAQADGNKQ
ncbi:MAG: hypothetical protein ACREPY_12765 [Rhodanobacteraceae bacterium]